MRIRFSLLILVAGFIGAACSGPQGAPSAAAATVATTATPGTGAPVPTSSSTTVAATSTTTSPATTTTVPATTPTTSSITTTTVPATTTTTTTTTLPPIVLGFAGDTSFTHGLDRRDPFGEVGELLTSPDLTLVNLETTIAERNVGVALTKTYTFKSPPASVGLLVEAGIDGVQVANNHIEDYRTPALERTLELLDEGGVSYAGAGRDAESAYAPRFFEVAGWTVGFVAFSRIPCGWAASGRNTRPEVAWACEAFVETTLTAVDAAADTADVVVVMVHWGIEKDYCPRPYQHRLAALWQARGADLIIGSHPHVLQGVERIGDAWLVHSTGNLAFPSARGVSASSAFFEFTVSVDDTTLRVTPITIRGGRPHPAVDDARARILRDLSSHSFGWAFDDDGTAFATDMVGRCGPQPALTPAPVEIGRPPVAVN